MLAAEGCNAINCAASLGKRLAHSRQRRVDQRQCIDAPGKRRPLVLRQIEVAAQVEQRGLLDCAADPSSLHQAVGGVGLAGCAVAGLGTSDEHRPMLHQDAAKRSPLTNYYGTTFHFSSDTQCPCGLAADEFREGVES